MSLVDKVKAQAEQAMSKAQAGMAQGQAKLEQVQATRHRDELLRNLGAAVWAERREGGSPAAVEEALRALDADHASQAPPQADRDGPAPTTDASGTPPAEG